MEQMKEAVKKLILGPLQNVEFNDIFEIIILSFLIYHILVWIKRTKAWSLLKGGIVCILFIGLVYILNLQTISWILSNLYNVGIIAIVIIFQPELRRALEQLGNNKIMSDFTLLSDSKDGGNRFTDDIINDIVEATFQLGKAKTGALIVIEQKISLVEYIKTGIPLDAQITIPLLIQIFEHNTPLHDGAVIIRKGRIVSATCYLPLSDNMGISKALGTRHRAGLGISEVSDSITIIASEETGHVSLAIGGQLTRNISKEQLREVLEKLQDKTSETKRFRLWKGKSKKDEGKTNQ